MQADTWHECYDQQLADVIVPEAFSHPAKMSWSLVQRIMGHLQAEWPAVRLVVDPMAGIGTVGLAAAYSGYTAILGELEGHFADLCAQNVAKHTARLRALGKPVPLLFRHDARAMPLGGVDCVVTSPPFGSSIAKTNGSQGKGTYTGTDLTQGLNRVKDDYATYGTHPAQLGNLRAVVTSPPWASSLQDGRREWIAAQMLAGKMRTTATGGNIGKAGFSSETANYGSHPGQLGNDSGTDYWSAMARVYLECARILPTGAPMILVVKGYISKGQYIDLPMQTAQLVDSCGFEVVHWHNASLVAREAQLGLFGGEERKARKSFFRRLAEKNGAPPIDNEIVLCAMRR